MKKSPLRPNGEEAGNGKLAVEHSPGKAVSSSRNAEPSPVRSAIISEHAVSKSRKPLSPKAPAVLEKENDHIVLPGQTIDEVPGNVIVSPNPKKKSIFHNDDQIPRTNLYRTNTVYDFLNEDSFMKGDRLAKHMDSTLKRREMLIRACFMMLDDNNTGSLNNDELELLDTIHSPFSSSEYLNSKQLFPSADMKSITFAAFCTCLNELIAEASKKKKNNIAGFESDMEVWLSLPSQFDANGMIFLVIFVLQFLLFTPAAIIENVDLGTLFISLASAAVVTFLIAFISNAKEMHNAVKRLYHSAPMATWTSIASYMLVAANNHIFLLLFRNSPFESWIAEVYFPWTANLLCLSGIAFITLYTIAPQSVKSMQRDVERLENYEFKCDTDDSVRNSKELLISFVVKLKGEEKSKRKLRHLWGIVGLLKHVLPCLIIPFQAIVLPKTILKSYGVDNYNDILRRRALLDFVDPYYQYLFGLAIGGLAIFLSSYSFEVFLKRITYRPFRNSRKMMEFLLATTSPVESCNKGVPYLPLHVIENLRAYVMVSRYLRTHEQGTQLGQASTGVAGLLFVDSVIIAAVVLRFFFVKPTDYRSLLIFSYYAVIATYWCAKILMEAVHINEIHDRSILRLLEIEGNLFLAREDERDRLKNPDRIVETIQRIRKSISVTYKPVTILGISATKGLLQVFTGYVVSALVALGSQFASYITS